MTKDLGDILIDQIKTLPFFDKYAGVVKTISMSSNDGDRSYVKRFPVECNISPTQCESRYKDLVPNNKNKSIIYLEDKGVSFVSQEGAWLRFSANYDIISWLNMPALGFTDCSYSAIAMGGMIKRLIKTPFAVGNYQRIMVTNINEKSKQDNPFSKYSYSEEVNQFLLYPYDYFVLNVTLEFYVNSTCFTEEALQPNLPCLTQ